MALRVAIVGSRTFPQLGIVNWFVGELPEGVVVVSGGAHGVDTAAAQAARERGLTVLGYPPKLEGMREIHEYTKAYHARNQKIVDASDLVIAFIEKNTGGTWDTIKRARRAGLPVKIIRPAAIPDVQQGTGEHRETQRSRREVGKGPFQLKRISLGSYALRLWRYFEPLEWVDFMNYKESAPGRCANMMTPDFLGFFHDINTAPYML